MITPQTPKTPLLRRGWKTSNTLNLRQLCNTITHLRNHQYSQLHVQREKIFLNYNLPSTVWNLLPRQAIDDSTSRDTIPALPLMPQAKTPHFDILSYRNIDAAFAVLKTNLCESLSCFKKQVSAPLAVIHTFDIPVKANPCTPCWAGVA